jgi:TatD DNase family protein
MSKKEQPSIKQGIIDTHCHLEMDQFSGEMDEVIKRAFSSGLEAMITIGSDPASNPKVLEIASAYEHVYCAVGVHPHEASQVDEALWDDMRAWAAHPKAVAIGETGLDYHYDNSPREVQKEVFRRHLALAKELDMPVVIHVREADDDAIEIIRASGIKKGVLHCFSGSSALLELAKSMGLYMSIAGPVTFKTAHELRDAVAKIPDELLLVETDSPYLTPVPFRGKRNEPAYVILTAAEVARVRGVTVQDIARLTTVNAQTLFGIGSMPEGNAFTYKIRDSLYLNITNRCTNKCGFCVRYSSDFVKGHNLSLTREPEAQELIEAIGEPASFDEIVFCGYGEPTLRLDIIKEVAKWVKDNGGKVRLNTNGHANLIHQRDVLPEFEGLVDIVSVSLNAPDAQTYDKMCTPDFEGAFDAVVDFMYKAKKYIPDVQATVVDAPEVDVDKCRRLCSELGVLLRVRSFNVVG